MYRVYLVDDEKIALDDMCNNLPWSDYSFMVTGRQTSPLQAIKAILADPVDIIFTDIRMPEMNGLEMIEKLRAAGCAAIFVVISAYDDFAYVRKTMLLSGFDYIIKPISADVSVELFDRLRARLDKNKSQPVFLPLTASQDLNRMTSYINEHITEKLTLGDISRQFNISPNHICTLFSKHLNVTFLNYVLAERMAIARNLLVTTSKAVKEIAILSGYDDYFYFCKVFRNYYQKTPTALRQDERGRL